MNWRKTALWCAGILAVLVIACVAALKVLVDPERLEQAAHDRVKAATGRELQVGGIALSFFPVPSVLATQVTLANPTWARERNLVAVEEVRADLELLPLLEGRMRVKALALDGVHLALEEADDGAVSWSFQRDEAAAKQPASEAESPMIHIGELRIRKASILHLDKRERAEPWQVEEAAFLSDAGLRNVTLEAKVSRHKQPLSIKAQFADLSHVGTEGAVSEGKLTLAWNETQATVSGRFPLERQLKGHALKAEAKSKSVQDALEFFGFDRGRTAPFELRLSSRDGGGGHMEIPDLAFTLGALEVRGDVRIASGKRPSFTAHLQTDRLDWRKTLTDAGGTLKPLRKDEEVYHADPVAWHALGVLGGLDGKADLDIGWLKLGNGVELQHVKAKADMGDGKLAIEPFAAELLGGSARGSFRFDAPKKTIRASLEGDKLLLERWFAERGSKLPFKGGPMSVKASLTLSGATFRELAASVDGPVSLRMGRGTWDSKHAGEAEEMMVGVLAPKGAQDLTFECAALKLDFQKGRASGRRLLGARTEASQLLTAGYVDFRDETLDLRGRVQAHKGVSLGLATIAAGVQITGKIARPRMGMDPGEKPAMLARAAAAIASSGATLVGEALLDAASKNDACAAVFK